MSSLETARTDALAELKDIAPYAETLSVSVNDAEVVDETTCGQMGDMRRDVQQQLKRAKAAKARTRKPLADELKALDQCWRPVINLLTAAEEVTKLKLDKYARDQYLLETAKAEEEAKAAREAMEQATQDAMELRGAGAGETADAMEQAAAHRLQKAGEVKVDPARGKDTTVSAVVTWKAKVDSVRDLCRAIAEGNVPVSAVEVQQSVLDGLARVVARETSRHGLSFYRHVSSVTKS